MIIVKAIARIMKAIWIPSLTAIIVVVLFGILDSFSLNPFILIRDKFYINPATDSVTIDVLDDNIIEIFQMASLEIDSRNASTLVITPGGFLNYGTLTLLLEYDSVVKFGIKDVQQIKMRRLSNVIFVDSSTIHIEILDSSVRNFKRAGLFKSNPLLSLTPAVLDQVFQEQSEFEAVAAQRLDNERNIETARRNFILQFEAICGGLGLTVVWE